MRKGVAAAFFCLASGMLMAAPAQAQVYWRIDTGWSRPASTDFRDNDFDSAGNICADPSCTSPGTVRKIDGSPLFGAGVGYRFAGGLRGDVTLSYRGFYQLNEFVGDATYTADINSTALMANGYYDFTAGDVRPYIGAGIGWARNDTKTLTQNFGLGFSNLFGGATKDNVAVALMVGVGVPSSGLTLDFGYRYIDLGKFKTGTSAAFGITSGHTGKLASHELTFGVRF